jgi:hypothetical protein
MINKIILPHFEMYAKNYPNLSFFKVDIDEIEIKEHAYLSSIPTFYGKFRRFLDFLDYYFNRKKFQIVIKDGNVVDGCVGACQKRLENLIVKHHNSVNNNTEV